MSAYIQEVAKREGFVLFATMTFRCLNGIESPGPDPSAPEGWEYPGKFFSDCEPEKTNNSRAVCNDARVVARRDRPTH